MRDRNLLIGLPRDLQRILPSNGAFADRATDTPLVVPNDYAYSSQSAGTWVAVAAEHLYAVFLITAFIVWLPPARGCMLLLRSVKNDA